MALTLDRSPHFLKTQDLPVLDGSMPVLVVYKHLAAQHRGAFIYRVGDEERFVCADRLAEALFAGAKNVDDVRRISEMTLERALERAGGHSIQVPVRKDRVVVTTSPGLLQSQGDAVFGVTKAGRQLGWFLNHETLLDPATRRVYFECENGHKDNPDMDHGTCYRCPGRIVGKADP